MKIRGIIAVALALAFPVTAFAKVEKAAVNVVDNSFVVSGKISSPLEKKGVKIIIINPRCKIEDLDGNNFSSALFCADDTLTDKDGAYNYSVSIPESSSSGAYTLYIQDDDSDVPEIYSVYYASDDKKIEIIANINNVEKNGMQTAFTDAIKPLSLDEELIQRIGIENIANTLYEYKSKNNLPIDNPQESVRILQEIIIVEAYNQGLAEECFDEGGKFKHTDYLDFKSVDKNGASFYEAYENILSESAKKAVRNGLLGKALKNGNDLLDKYSELVILKGISAPMTDGTGHIEKLLTAENAKALGDDNMFNDYINLKNAVAKNNVEIDLMKEDYDDIDELVKKLKSLLNKYATSDNSSGGSGGSGGGSSGNSSSSSAGTFVPVEKVDKNGTVEMFSDLEDVSWAKEAIEYLYTQKIVSGIGENKFAPKAEVTREQFVVMLVNALNLELSEEDTEFTDVITGSYYAKHIATAKKAGIVNGISDDKFGVGSTLTREDICTMIYRACFDGKTASVEMTFTDKDEISDYAKAATAYMAEEKIINGFSDGTFLPKDICTRAQAAKILYETLMIYGK